MLPPYFFYAMTWYDQSNPVADTPLRPCTHHSLTLVQPHSLSHWIFQKIKSYLKTVKFEDLKWVRIIWKDYFLLKLNPRWDRFVPYPHWLAWIEYETYTNLDCYTPCIWIQMCLSVYEGLLLSMWVHFSRIVPPCGAHIRHMQVMGGGKYHSDQIILTNNIKLKI